MALLGAFAMAAPVRAQIEVGTWVRQAEAAMPGVMTMTVERCCGNGRRILYRMEGAPTMMTFESRFDGSEAPMLVDGKPTGETMAVKRLDDHHTFTVMKRNGKAYGTSKAALSADGKTITVENEITSAEGGQRLGKSTEVWVRK
jgi:hypothetical protein